MNNHFDFSEMPRILLEAVLILSLGITVGLAVNHRLVTDLLEGNVVAPQVATDAVPAGIELLPLPVDIATVQSALTSGSVLLDARISELFNEEHISGARSFPLDEADTLIPALMEELPPEASLITYCNGYGCPDSYALGVKLLAAGFRNVAVFEGGIPEWRDAGLPIEGEK
ncbi:MAG: rhodanese-like domain-containing protein [Desulfuromonas sp.]|nr:MAG: rhodanese-like domain-containing protein [Desulfuromonas sp.]